MAAKDNIKGITVEIGGDTTGLNNALKDTETSSKNIEKELKSVNALLKFDPENTVALTQKQELLGKSVETAAEKVRILKEAQEQVEEQFKNGEIGEQAYRSFQREVEFAEQALTKAETAVKDFSGEAGDAEEHVEELAEEVENTGEAAEDAGSKFEAFGSIVAGVGAAVAAGAAAVGAAVVGIGTALVGASQDAAAYADDMLTMSTNTGISTETLQAYSYAAELVDVSLDTLTGSMAKNIKSMNSARDGTGAMAEAYEKLGISVTNSDGTLRDGEEVYWNVVDALGQMEEGSERDAIAMQILGKSAQDLNSLIAVGSEGIAEFTAEAHAMGAVMSEENLNALGDLEDGMQRLSSTMSAAQNNVGLIAASALTEYYEGASQIVGNFSELINTALSGDEITDEMITSFADSVVEMVEGVTSEIPRIIEVVSTIITAVVEAIVQALPDVVNAITEFLPDLLAVVSEMLPDIVDAAVEIILAIVAALIEALPQIAEAGIEIITSLISGIAEALPELIPAAVGAIMAIVQALIDNLPMLLEAALEIIVALAEGILEALPVLIEALPAIIIGIIDFVIGAIPQIIEAGIKLLTSLIEALPEIISAIVKAIPEIITSLIDAILGNIPLIIEAGISLFIALVEALPQIITEVVKAVPQIITSLVTAFTSKFSDIKDVGKDLIKGLWDGISGMASWIGDKISGFCDGIVSGFKSIFGIASPSKLFRDEIGAELAAGVGDGFVKKMDSVADMMHKAVPTDFSTEINAAHNVSNSGVSTQGANAQFGLLSGGDTFSFVVNAANIKELNDLIRIAENARQSRRMNTVKG